MKNKSTTVSTKSWPRLLVENEEGREQNQNGFLQVTSFGKKIALGETYGREFRLMQCLFSPQNFLSAKYAPVIQTYERLYSAIKISTDSTNEKLSNLRSSDAEMRSIVGGTVRSLKAGDAGKYLTFIQVDDKLMIEVANPA